MSRRDAMLHAASVSKTFRVGSRFRTGGIQHVHALTDASLDVFPGETVGLVGESGCGKSTFGRCLLRLYNVDDGHIVFKDRDIVRLSQRELRRRLANMQMAFQDLTPHSVRAGGSMAGERARHPGAAA
jgi:peptide/nickel transport system ATP-binding protein